MSDALVIEAVRKTVTVDCTVEEAFRVFTTDATSWWPLATRTRSPATTVEQVVFEPGVEGGEVYELTAGGEKWPLGDRRRLGSARADRARVEHPRARGRRHRGRDPLPRRRHGTQVELEHRGWEAIAEDAEAKRENYDTGWGQVLGSYERRLG